MVVIKKKVYVFLKDFSFLEVIFYGFKINWFLVGENVFLYYIIYKEVIGDDEVIVVELVLSISVVFSNLKLEILYLVNVIVEYEDGFSIFLVGEEIIEEVKGVFWNLKVIDEIIDSFKIIWI